MIINDYDVFSQNSIYTPLTPGIIIHEDIESDEDVAVAIRYQKEQQDLKNISDEGVKRRSIFWDS